MKKWQTINKHFFEFTKTTFNAKTVKTFKSKKNIQYVKKMYVKTFIPEV